MMKKRALRIGVIGYSSQSFNENEAWELLCDELDSIIDDETDVEIVSGMSYMGIPALAYDYAEDKGYTTVGFACSKVFEYELYPVDKKFVIGDEWGDESEDFLNYIDVLVKLGGGKQSKEEYKTFRKLYPTAYAKDIWLDSQP